MMYESLEEYDTEIRRTQDAIARILDQGESWKAGSGDATWEYQMTRLPTLREHLRLLDKDKKSLIAKNNGVTEDHLGGHAAW